MKLTTFALLPLAAFVFAAPAIVDKRALMTANAAAATLDTLLGQVKALTGQINQTIAAAPAGLPAAEAQKVAQAIAPQMDQLQALLAQATSTIQSGGTVKRDVATTDTGCTGSCLTGKASGIVAEISGTVKGVIGSLGVDNVTSIVQPVLTQVTGLLTCLDQIVSGLAKTVGGLLNGLLGGLGLDSLLNGLLGGLLGGLLSGGNSGCGLLGGLLGGC